MSFTPTPSPASYHNSPFRQFPISPTKLLLKNPTERKQGGGDYWSSDLPTSNPISPTTTSNGFRFSGHPLHPRLSPTGPGTLLNTAGVGISSPALTSTHDPLTPSQFPSPTSLSPTGLGIVPLTAGDSISLPNFPPSNGTQRAAAETLRSLALPRVPLFIPPFPHPISCGLEDYSQSQALGYTPQSTVNNCGNDINNGTCDELPRIPLFIPPLMTPNVFWEDDLVCGKDLLSLSQTNGSFCTETINVPHSESCVVSRLREAHLMVQTIISRCSVLLSIKDAAVCIVLILLTVLHRQPDHHCPPSPITFIALNCHIRKPTHLQM